MRKMVAGILAGAVLALAACGDETLAPLELQITVRAAPTQVAVGDSVRFDITAQGGRLLGVRLDYGDLVVEAVSLLSARTATLFRHHAYTRSWTYEVTATVEDFSQGTKRATATVQVR